jgi:mRNA interferase RelE/StbE
VTYEVILARTAQRHLNELPLAVAAAVVAFVSGPLAQDPYRVGKPLAGSRKGQHSARRGEYRIIYTIDDQRVLVTVIALRHRRDAYR